MNGEGRSVKNATSWDYEYDLKDHLGNTRISILADNNQVSVLQVKDYYPFGLEMTNGQSTMGEPTKYLYNGKELQDEAGLDFYDYGARFYDPAIGRWHVTDPMAEQAPEWSPFRYGFNNPVSFTDPTGMFETKYETVDHKLLLKTLDGSDDVVTVSNIDEQAFKDAATSTIGDVVNSVGWNERMKDYLSSGWLFGYAYNTLGKEFAQEAFINSVNDPSISNSLEYFGAYIASRWLTPEIVVGNLSAGITAYGMIPNKVYRVYGGDSKADGFSWTPTNPNSVNNFRDAAGLPSGGASGYNNTDRFVIEGTVENRNLILTRPALPLDGNKGGLKEFIINPSNVNIKRVSGVNPHF